MKKLLFTALFLLAMLASLVGTAGAAPMASKSATLVGVMYTDKGPVFTFDVSGKFSRSDLKGSLSVQGGGNYGLYCTDVDEDTVTCNTSKKVSGVNVSLSWGGFSFWTYVPEGSSDHCYDVYDWNFDQPYTEWVKFGEYCQDSPAAYGDIIFWDNPGWGATFPYEFLPESPDIDWCPFRHGGNAYYYPACPGGAG